MALEALSNAGIDKMTNFLMILRVLLVFLPQFGYIHPDEFFQSTEITAGEVLNTDSYRPWEFTSENPLRCSVFVHLFAYLPYKVLSFVGGSAYLRLVLPRCVASLLSFVVDYVVFQIRGAPAVKVVATSYLAMVYFTRTFSNVTETVLFAILILLSFPLRQVETEVDDETSSMAEAEADAETTAETNGESPADGKVETAKPEHESLSPKQTPKRQFPVFHSYSTEAVYVTVIVCGIFNRPTFLCFALTPFFFRFFSTNNFKNFLLACVRMSLYAVPSCCLLILIDSIYYRGFDEFLADPISNIVITPLNFLLYNSDSGNLANHGLHQRWLHFVINIPLLFGLHSVYIYRDIYRLILKRENFNIEKFSLHMCTIVPLLVLSAFPHQEPRFLLPLLIPFALRNALKLTQSDRFCGMWYAFNIYMFIFFALAHQAGVVPMQMNTLEGGKYVYFHTYMPPRHLTPDGVVRQVIDLKESNLRGLEEIFQKHREGYVIYPAGLHSIVVEATIAASCTLTDPISLYPHVATEYLNHVLQSCGLGLKCLIFDSFSLNRIKFNCEATL